MNRIQKMILGFDALNNTDPRDRTTYLYTIAELVEFYNADPAIWWANKNKSYFFTLELKR